eukprot:gene17510-5735_t
MIAVKTRTADGGWHIAITEGTVSFNKRIWDGLDLNKREEHLKQRIGDVNFIICLDSGEGGFIPFMGMLGKMFPGAQFLMTGVLGPSSNAHGPNEFLHIDYSKRLTCCVASILHSHGNRDAGSSAEEPAAKRAKPTPEELTRHYGRNADGTKL